MLSRTSFLLFPRITKRLFPLSARMVPEEMIYCSKEEREQKKYLFRSQFAHKQNGIWKDEKEGEEQGVTVGVLVLISISRKKKRIEEAQARDALFEKMTDEERAEWTRKRLERGNILLISL